MSAPFEVCVCAECDYVAHPPRLLCPRCGSDDWHRRAAELGVIRRLTSVLSLPEPRRSPPRDWLDEAEPWLAEVTADVGVQVIARVPKDVALGARVTLVVVDGVTVALPQGAPST